MAFFYCDSAKCLNNLFRVKNWFYRPSDKHYQLGYISWMHLLAQITRNKMTAARGTATGVDSELDRYIQKTTGVVTDTVLAWTRPLLPTPGTTGRGLHRSNIHDDVSPWVNIMIILPYWLSFELDFVARVPCVW